MVVIVFGAPQTRPPADNDHVSHAHTMRSPPTWCPPLPPL